MLAIFFLKNYFVDATLPDLVNCLLIRFKYFSVVRLKYFLKIYFKYILNIFQIFFKK